MLASDARVADSFLARLVGLLATKADAFQKGKGLLISPCNQIHMFGMKYAIDVVFMDKSGVVVGLCKSIAPGAASRPFGKAHECLELPSGVISDTGTVEGDLIERAPLPCPYE